MPTYVYECPKCQKTLEMFQKITDEGRPDCFDCMTRMERVIQPSTFVLVGSGWSKDGYTK